MGNRREPMFYGGLRQWPHAISCVRNALARLRSEEEGQAVLEYILILTATVVGAGLMSRKIIQVVDTGILKLGGQLEKDLKTGRVPLDIWKN